MLCPRSLAATRYTIDHEWISYDFDSKIGTIGVTEYAQQVRSSLAAPRLGCC